MELPPVRLTEALVETHVALDADRNRLEIPGVVLQVQHDVRAGSAQPAEAAHHRTDLAGLDGGTHQPIVARAFRRRRFQTVQFFFEWRRICGSSAASTRHPSVWRIIKGEGCQIEGFPSAGRRKGSR